MSQGSLDFETLMLSEKIKAEAGLREALNLNRGPAPVLMESMEYSLFAGGKRIRPILAARTFHLFHPDGPDLSALFSALEILHTYSLVHDDLPCMDNADLRRGQPTCHIKFGTDMATLAGDAMLTLAFEVLLEFGQKASLEPKILNRMIFILCQSIGAAGMIGGQVLDIHSTTSSLSLEELLILHQHKTGKLFEASILLGVLAASASKKEETALLDYARSFGLLFQITDDILDVTGEKEVMGKPSGQDAHFGKSTFPSILGLEKSLAYAKKTLEEGLESLAVFGPEAFFHRQLLYYLLKRQH